MFQQVICDLPYRDEFIVRWRVQLRKNRSAVSTFVEKDSPSSRTTKSSFIRRSANFGNVSLFSSTTRGNKRIFRAYPSTLKIAELCFDRGTQREYGSKPLKHSIVKRISVFKR